MKPTFDPITGFTYRPGALAYLDSFGGLVPCKVLAVAKGGPYPGWIVGQSEPVTVQVTAVRAGYRKGETLTGRAASHVVPRGQVFTRGHKRNIRTNYSWRD